MTAVGSDRPGLVNEISRAIKDAGANLEDSRMAILGGEFAIVVLLSGHSSALEAVDRLVQPMADHLQISFKDTQALSPGASVRRYRLEVSGVERPGIVEAVTQLRVGREINLEALASHLAHAPYSGTPTFVLEARLLIPAATGLAELRTALGELCEEQQLDYVLETSV